MNWDSIKGYVLTIFSLLVIAAIAVEVLLNISNPMTWALYGKIREGDSIAVLFLIFMLAGIVFYFMVRLLIYGIKDLRRGRREAKVDQVAKMQKKQAAASQQTTQEK